MRVQTDPTQIGRCGCGRREFCDGSHSWTEEEWQQILQKEQQAAAAQGQADGQGEQPAKDRRQI